MKKKIHKLSLSVPEEFIVIGISSHENDYHLSWALNKDLGINLVKVPNLKTFNEKLKLTQEFSVYFFNNKDNHTSYRLISNCSEEGYLITEYSNIDFFLLIEGDLKEDAIELFIQKLKKTNIVNTAFLISTLNQKNLNKFSFL